MKIILKIILISLLLTNLCDAKSVPEMNSNSNPVVSDLTYTVDVSDTSENSQGTSKKARIDQLFKAANMTIDGVNIGIASTNPSSRLDVLGTVKATAFIGDGSGLTNLPSSGGGGEISDDAYSSSWDGNTTVGASKNALYDKIETITATSPWVDSGSVIYPSSSTDNVGIGTSQSTSKLSIMGGGVQAEFVNKGWERIPQPALQGISTVDFIEVNAMLVHKGYLYLGYDIDDFLGSSQVSAQIWRWDGNEYEYLATLGTNNEFGAVAFIILYKGKLYAGVSGVSSTAGDVYESSDDGYTWTKVFDGPNPFAYSAVVFKDHLYVGSGYFGLGEIYKYDGSAWTTPAAISGCGQVISLHVYKERMFAACGNTATIFSTPDGTNWTQELSRSGTEFNHFVQFRGKLYANMLASGNPIYVRDDNTATWSNINAGVPGSQGWGMIEYNDVLYIGLTIGASDPSKIYKSYDGITFEEEFTIPWHDGWQEYESFKAINYNGSLYFGMGGNGIKSATLWRKTDSIGQLFDKDHEIVRNFSFNTKGVNWNDDRSLMELHSPISFKSKVGIGTSFPTQALDVIGTLKVSNLISCDTIDTDSSGNLSCGTDDGGGGGSGTINSGVVGAFPVYTATTTIDDSPVLFGGGSNVGIGTTGPTQALQVVGTVSATSFSGAGTGLTGTAASLTAGTVTTNANLTGEVTSSGNSATIADSVTVTGWNLGASTATTPSGGDNDTSIATTAYVQTEISGLGGGSGGWTDGGSNVYLSTTTDTVGIGTTGASGSLEIVKQGSAAPLMVSSTATSDGDYLIVRSSGNVGIGTTIPITKLAVRASPVTVFSVTSTGASSSSSGAGIQAYVDDGAAVVQGDRLAFYTFGGSADTADTMNSGGAITGFAEGTFSSSSAPTEIRIETAATGSTTRTPRVYVKSGGNVGIGTALPRGTLDLGPTGTIFTQTITGTSGGIQSFAGNVGIGTVTAGSALLEIGTTGQLKISSTGGLSSVGIGTTVPMPLCRKADGTFGTYTGATWAGTCN